MKFGATNCCPNKQNKSGVWEQFHKEVTVSGVETVSEKPATMDVPGIKCKAHSTIPLSALLLIQQFLLLGWHICREFSIFPRPIPTHDFSRTPKEYMITLVLTNIVSDMVHMIISHLLITFPSFFNHLFPQMLVVFTKSLTPILPYYNKVNNTLISTGFQITLWLARFF